mgnify:CR=1 FL=1
MVDILGPDGQPVRRARPERQHQTSRLGTLHREVADHPTRGLTPARLAQVLEQAEQGDLVAQARLAMDMEEKDAHIYAELAKRRIAIQATPWYIEAPEDATPAEERAVELCQHVLDEIDVTDLLWDLSDAILHAFVGLEYHWQLVDGVNVPTAPVHRPQDWFKTPIQRKDELRIRDASADGLEPNPLNWILHRHKSRSGYIARAGLVRVLCWPFLMRALSTRDLAEFLEIYGLPLRVGKYPNGATEDEKKTLLNAVMNIGHAAAGIIPESMMIEFKEAAKAGAGGDPFHNMIAWAEGSVSKAVLGGTLTTSAENTGLGSNLGDVHNEVRTEIKASDCRQIARCIELQFLRPITALNTTAERAPRFVFELDEPEDIQAMSDALPKLAGIGMQIPVEWAHEKLHIPMAEDGQAVLGAPRREAPPGSPPPGAPDRGEGEPDDEPDDDTPDEPPEPDDEDAEDDPAVAAANQRGVRLIADPAPALVDRLADDAATPLGEWIEQIRGMVDRAESLDELRDSLINAYGDLDSGRMVEVMETAFAVAEAAGRFDVGEESGAL